jgi:hypothetical protein
MSYSVINIRIDIRIDVEDIKEGIHKIYSFLIFRILSIPLKKLLSIHKPF